MVIPKGVEPLIFWMRTRRPGPLDDGTICNNLIRFPKRCKASPTRRKIDFLNRLCYNYIMFKPLSPEQIRNLVEHIILQQLKAHGDFVPDFFLAKAEPLIKEAIDWQAANPKQSVYGNFRADLKAKHLAQKLINSDEGERYELSDENLERLSLLEEATTLYAEQGKTPSDEELCQEFDFTPAELAALRAIQTFKQSQ